MEQSEGFRNAVAKIKALEEQLSLCDNALREHDRSEKVIEDFFAQCMNALAARKQALLEDTAQKLSSRNKSIEEAKQKLSATITASNHTLAASALVFNLDKNAAEIVWKGIVSVVVPQVNLAPVTPKLPTSLIDMLQKGGEATENPEYCLAPEKLELYDKPIRIEFQHDAPVETAPVAFFTERSSTEENLRVTSTQESDCFVFIPNPAKCNSTVSVFCDGAKMTIISVTLHPYGRAIKFIQAYNLPFVPLPNSIQLRGQILKVYFP